MSGCNGIGESRGEAELKVIRAKQSACQLSTYLVGRMAMFRLRSQVQRAQGEAFDLAKYHEAVLNEGAVPVRVLPELVRARLGMKDKRRGVREELHISGTPPSDAESR
jgi:uncharacterized protein (DUF885 family)